MTLKENGNGNYFAAWLQEYKTRLEQAKLRGTACIDKSNNVLVDTSSEHECNEKAAHPPALAGEIYFVNQQPGTIGIAAN